MKHLCNKNMKIHITNYVKIKCKLYITGKNTVATCNYHQINGKFSTKNYITSAHILLATFFKFYRLK